MKKIINTTNERLEVQVKGYIYVLEPKGELILPKDVVDYWKDNIHEFLITEELPVEVKKEVKEIEITEEVKDIKSKKTK